MRIETFVPQGLGRKGMRRMESSCADRVTSYVAILLSQVSKSRSGAPFSYKIKRSETQGARHHGAPAPVSLTDCGEPAAESVMVRLPVRVPVAVGVNTT